MITGDHPLTSLHVAYETNIAPFKKFFVLEAPDEASGDTLKKKLRWVSTSSDLSNVEIFPFDVKATRELAKTYSLCVPGSALLHL